MRNVFSSRSLSAGGALGAVLVGAVLVGAVLVGAVLVGIGAAPAVASAQPDAAAISATAAAGPSMAATDCPPAPMRALSAPITTTPAIPKVRKGTIFGVDIASPQGGIDLDAFTKAGGKFAIIKQGGGNADDAPYIAPRYEEQLAGARAAGLPVGHYWFNGQKLSVEDQAAFFVEHAHIEEGDVIALDIEDEPETCTRAFTPEEAECWIAEVQKTYPGIKVLLYLNLSLIRGHDWSKLTAHPLWVAAWDQNDGTIPKGDPELTWWKDWAIWQYSSVVRVPGFDGDLDGNMAKKNVFEQYGWKG